jgi:ribose transport system permease protein
MFPTESANNIYYHYLLDSLPTSFASFRNFSAILRNLAFEGILAIGIMSMRVGGNFDLSVGSMASMIGVVTGAVMKSWNWPVPLAVATGRAGWL